MTQPMELYLTPTSPTAPAVQAALDVLGLPYTLRDIDRDADARRRLLGLTDSVRVPTLVLPDGTALVQPTPPQLAAALRPYVTAAAKPARTSTLPPWLVIGLGLASFSLGLVVGRSLGVLKASGASGVIVVALLAGGLLSLLPPVRRLLGWLRRWPPWMIARWSFVPVYAGALGLGLAGRAGPDAGGVPHRRPAGPAAGLALIPAQRERPTC